MGLVEILDSNHNVLFFFQKKEVLLQRNSTSAYISYQPLLPESLYHRPDNSIRIFEYHTKNHYPKTKQLHPISKPDSFRVCGLRFFNLLAETNNFGLGAILLSRLVPEQQKHYHRDSNRGQLFEVVAFVHVTSLSKQRVLFLTPLLSCRATETIFTETRIQSRLFRGYGICYSPKQTTLVFALFFYCAKFSIYRNRLHKDSNPGQIYGIMAFVPVISPPKQKLWS
jgi:hypothetical protein